MNTEESPIGLRLAALITYALASSKLLKAKVGFEEIEAVVYKECERIANEQQVGDWLEMPDGTSYNLIFKPERGK